jgi:hypothetical protein
MVLVSCLVLLVTPFWGCAGLDLYPGLNQRLQAGDCQGAVALIDASAKAYGGNSQLLFLLDSAMVGLQCGDFDQAQERLRAAERLADQLWTESVSRNVASFLTNDNTLAYGGEDYERVMIHLASAIGYLQTGQLDEALVEVRRLDSLLQMFGDKYRDEPVYRSDAFGRYLSGILHEADGAYDDAFIDYLQAVRIYQNEWRSYGLGVPAGLAEDLLSLGERVGRRAEAHEALGQPPDDLPAATPGQDPLGKVVLILFSGEGPRKVAQNIIVPTINGPIGIAIPQIEPGAPACDGGTLLLDDDQGIRPAELALVSDINQIALKALEDRKGRIVAKALARAVAKQVVIKGVANTQKEKRDQQTVELLLNVANTLFLERADLRCWRTLPGRIWLARAWAAPGRYQAQAQLCGHATYALGEVDVVAGQTHFLFLDTHFDRGSAMGAR